MMMMNVNLYSV